MDSIAKTSLLTAAMRAVETERKGQGQLFQDPYAATLAGDDGFLILKKAIEASGDQPAIAIRTAFIDDQIKKAVANHYEQFVFLAAGMDTRAYRMDLSSSICIFEIDRPEVIAYKKKKLNEINTTCQLISISTDLNHNWIDLLISSGFQKNKKTFWLVEGLVMYLEEDQVNKLFDQMNMLSKPNDTLVLDILSQTLLQAPHMKNQLQFLADMGAPWKFGTDYPENFFAKWGWNCTLSQPAEFAPHRWPFPLVPRHIPNVPRGFYLVGLKK